jgi:hypothetical protein
MVFLGVPPPEIPPSVELPWLTVTPEGLILGLPIIKFKTTRFL